MAGMALKRSRRSLIKDLLKKSYYFIFIGEFCVFVFNSICRGYHLDFGDHL